MEQFLIQNNQQNLLMTYEMKRALQILSLPILELSDFLSIEIEKNPLLEAETPKEKEYSPQRTSLVIEDDIFQSIPDKNSLFKHLVNQATETFKTKEQVNQAIQIIGQLDHRGYLTTPLDEIADSIQVDVKKLQETLKIVQTFEPSGIAASSLQECFLIQLSKQKKENTLAFKIIKNHFQDFLNNRLHILEKNLKLPKTTIQLEMEKGIKNLHLRPASLYTDTPCMTIIPDVLIEKKDKKWTVLVNNEGIFSFKINDSYQKLLYSTSLKTEEKQFIKKHISAGYWLMENIRKRESTLKDLSCFLLQKQIAFFQEGKKILPLTYLAAASELQIHPSTIARAIANKYIETPFGVFPLRFFFSSSLKTEKEVSQQSILSKLIQIIKEEDKTNPFSDEKICEMLKKDKITCSRRAITKYRKKLLIGSSKKRKKFT